MSDLDVVREALECLTAPDCYDKGIAALDRLGAQVEQLQRNLDVLRAQLTSTDAENVERVEQLQRENELWRKTEGIVDDELTERAEAAEARADRLAEALRQIEHWPFNEHGNPDIEVVDIKSCARAALVAVPSDQPKGEEEDEWKLVYERVEPHALCCAECRARVAVVPSGQPEGGTG